MTEGVVQVVLPPSSGSARAARLAVTDLLQELGRADLIDDATLIATELVANAVMHARTEMSLTVVSAGEGVRVTVTDKSDIQPRWTPASTTATAGRGLLLVERLSSRWACEPVAAGGKSVWAEIDAASACPDESSPEELLELWPDEPWPAAGGADADADVAVTLEIDVAAMLASRAHTDELVRDLQLTLLNAADRHAPTEATEPVVDLARRLDSVNEGFHEARRQMYNQTIGAYKRGHAQATLRLELHRGDAALALRWLAALDDADALAASGALLIAPFPPELSAFRRRYIADIVEQLDAAG
jgi:anti-sigma regulatory factor (Ser/Thr protein kinase)